MHSTNETPVVTEPVAQFACSSCGMVSDLSELKPFVEYLCPGCSAELTVPARFGNFLLLKLLGSGGMGSVFLAQDETLGRKVALKVMLKSLGDNPQFVETFKREAQAAAKLNHPHIAQIYAFGQEAGKPYIVMELVTGKSLDALIDSGNRLSTAFIVKIGADIAAGLKLAADINLVHGDIKPENILLNERSHAKLVDFGIAGMTNQPSNEIWGTPYYIAPEKVRRQRIDHRADIYSLGATLYHAIAGQPPFRGETAIDVVKARFKGAPEPLSEIRPDVDPQVSQMIERMLQVEPAMRYPTYESLLGDMRRYLDTVGDLSRLMPTEGGKRLVIRKKAAGGPSASSSQSSDDVGSPSTSGRGLVIARGQFGDTATHLHRLTDDALNADEADERKDSRRLWLRLGLALGVVAIVVLAAGAAWFFRRGEPPVPPVDETEETGLPGPEETVSDPPDKPDSVEADVAAREQALEVLARAEQAAGEARERLDDATGTVTQVLADEVPRLDDPAVVGLRNAVQSGLETLRVSCEAVMQAAGQARRAYQMYTGEITPDVEDDPPPPPKEEDAPEPDENEPGTDEDEPETDEDEPESAENEPDAADTPEPEAVTDEGSVDGDMAADDPDAPPEPRLQGTLDEVRTHAEEAELMLGVANRQWQELRGTLDRYVETRERVVREAEEARRHARIEAERLAKIEAEMAQVREVETEQAENVRKRLYREARWAVRDLVETMETEAGREAAERVRNRLERVIALHAFLAEETGKSALPRVWLIGGVPHDITAAGETGLTIRGKEIPWNEAFEFENMGNIVRLLQHLLLEEPRSQAIRLRQRVDQLVNAAIFCLVYGRNSPHAMTLARNFAHRAIEQFPAVQVEIEALAPDLEPQAP